MSDVCKCLNNWWRNFWGKCPTGRHRCRLSSLLWTRYGAHDRCQTILEMALFYQKAFIMLFRWNFGEQASWSFFLFASWSFFVLICERCCDQIIHSLRQLSWMLFQACENLVETERLTPETNATLLSSTTLLHVLSKVSLSSFAQANQDWILAAKWISFSAACILYVVSWQWYLHSGNVRD